MSSNFGVMSWCDAMPFWCDAGSDHYLGEVGLLNGMGETKVLLLSL